MLALIYTNGFIILLKNYKLDNALAKKNLNVLRNTDFATKQILQH